MMPSRKLACLMASVQAFVLIVMAVAIGGCATRSGPQNGVSRPSSMTASTIDPQRQAGIALARKDFQEARRLFQHSLQEARKAEDEAGMGTSLNGLGAVALLLGDYDEALHLYSEALSHLRRGGIPKELVGAYLGVGACSLFLKKYSEAVEAIDLGLSLLKGVPMTDSEDENKARFLTIGQATYYRATACRFLGKYSESVENYARAAVEFQKAGKDVSAGDALLWAGDVSLVFLSSPEPAGSFYSHALDLVTKSDRVPYFRWITFGLGAFYISQGDFNKAAGVFAQNIQVVEKRGLCGLSAVAHFGLGRAFEGLMHFQEALDQYGIALEQLSGCNWKGFHLLESEVYFLKGKIHRILCEYDEAIESFHAAAVKSRQEGEIPSEAACITELAEIFFWMADYQAAVSLYRQAQQLYAKAGHSAKEIEVMAELVDSTLLTGSVSKDEIVEYYRRVEDLRSELEQAIDFEPLQFLQERQDEYVQDFMSQNRESILKWHRELARQDAECAELVLTFQAVARTSPGVFQEWKTKAPSLGADYLRALGAWQQKGGRMQLQWGEPSRAIGILAAAITYHTSLPFNRDVAVDVAKDLYYTAEAYRQVDDLKQALCFFRVLEWLLSWLHTQEIHWAKVGLARTFADMGEVDKAIMYYDEALTLLESIQSQQGMEHAQIGVMEGALYVYSGFTTMLLDLYRNTGDERYLSESLECHERQRARAFLDMLGRSQMTRLGGETARVAEEEEGIRRQIAGIHARLRTRGLERTEETRLLEQLQKLRHKWNTLQREAGQENSRYQEVVFPHPVTVEEVQAVLDPETVLLEYATAHEGSTLWAITKDQVRVYSVPGQEGLPVLKAFLKTLREPLMTSGEVSKHIDLGQQLYEALVRPAEEEIQGKRHLIIAPDGPLHYLPFEALIMPDSGKSPRKHKHLADAPYLLKRFQVNYVPSASALVAQEKRTGDRGLQTEYDLLALGDPIYQRTDPLEIEEPPLQITRAVLRDSSLERLRFSGEEVRRIANIWGVHPESAHINLRNEATVERLRSLDLSQYRMLHFATHAVVDDEVGWATQPTLVLSQQGGTPESGLFQFSDIMGLSLRADLVTLSACKTGMGKLYQGEGIVGLTRAFLYAGASSVAVSLWKVEDQATCLLMERFYQHLKEGVEKAKALRNAKLDILRSEVYLEAIGQEQALAAPFYWAAFVLVGSPD